MANGRLLPRSHLLPCGGGIALRARGKAINSSGGKEEKKKKLREKKRGGRLKMGDQLSCFGGMTGSGKKTLTET